MSVNTWRVLVTGSSGFIGKNLVVRLGEMTDTAVRTFDRRNAESDLPELIAQTDCIFHLAGENRPQDESAFTTGNVQLTEQICSAVKNEFDKTGRRVHVVFASSAQATLDNAYGRSKLSAEKALGALAQASGIPVTIFRLPGVFGKWCKPNYNSVVATFCHNISRDLPIKVSDPNVSLRLVYVDDVIDALLQTAKSAPERISIANVETEYQVTLGELEAQIRAFASCRTTLVSERVGSGFVRALYATYVSYLPEDRFSYKIPQYGDPRGVFVEMLKTPDSGQFSFFTAGPGITRGGHYHHTKTEKFLVVKGAASFRFRHIITNQVVEVRVDSRTPEIVDTIPGWAHDITNIGDEEMVVMLWANENFDRLKPDTVTSRV